MGLNQGYLKAARTEESNEQYTHTTGKSMSILFHCVKRATMSNTQTKG